jgi:hypothetical protein
LPSKANERAAGTPAFDPEEPTVMPVAELQQLIARFEILEARLAALEKPSRSVRPGRPVLVAGLVTLLAAWVLVAQPAIRPDPATQPLPPAQRNNAERQGQGEARTLTAPVIIVDGSGQRLASFISQNGFRGMVLGDSSGGPALVFSADQSDRGIDILGNDRQVVAHLGQ